MKHYEYDSILSNERNFLCKREEKLIIRSTSPPNDQFLLHDLFI